MIPIFNSAKHLSDYQPPLYGPITFHLPPTLTPAGKKQAIALLADYAQTWRQCQETKTTISYEMGCEVKEYAYVITATMLRNAWQWLLGKISDDLWVDRIPLNQQRGVRLISLGQRDLDKWEVPS